MHRSRSLGIALGMAVLVAGCGDDATWPGGGAPPLNAGPGVNSLYVPVEGSTGGAGLAAIIGDWFRCRGEGSDPCTTLENPGVGFRATGLLVGLLAGFGSHVQPGVPYCEIPTGKTWTLEGGQLKVQGEDAVGFSIAGNRATATDDGHEIVYLRQSLSAGPCADARTPSPG